MPVNLLCDVTWDTEGETLQACCLPETVIILGAPDDYATEDYQTEFLAELFETFGVPADDCVFSAIRPPAERTPGGLISRALD